MQCSERWWGRRRDTGRTRRRRTRNSLAGFLGVRSVATGLRFPRILGLQQMRTILFETSILIASLTINCGPPPILARQTTASNARSDDPWLVGARCTPDTPADANVRTQVLAEGTGAPVTPGMTVRTHYVASLSDGQVVHNEDMPSEIILGSTRTICGFERALAGMRPGEQRRIEVPWQLAFGDAGRPPEIPPRTDLVFVIDLYLPADLVVNSGAPPPNPIQNGRVGQPQPGQMGH